MSAPDGASPEQLVEFYLFHVYVPCQLVDRVMVSRQSVKLSLMLVTPDENMKIHLKGGRLCVSESEGT